jgi:endonuclease G
MGESKKWAALTFWGLLIVIHTLYQKVTAAEPEYRIIQSESYSIFVNCARRAADVVMYGITADVGNAKRVSNFHRDTRVPARCQQLATGTYRGNLDGFAYHRGHLMAFNHKDDNDALALETNSMVNILPQSKSLNLGVFYQTEVLTECYRELADLLVFVGPIWGADTGNDWFVKSHGIETPDSYWKLVYSPQIENYIAWIMPNTEDMGKEKIKQYQVDFATLKAAITSDNAILAAMIPWPAEISGKEHDMVDWDYKVEGRYGVSCAGQRTSLG